jgi:hypothetical protein
MTLHELFVTAIQRGALTSTRIRPMRHSMKTYASCLGMTPETCPPEQYYRSDAEVMNLIEAKAPAHWAPISVRNLKNNMVYLLKIGRTHGWLTAPETSVNSWATRRRLKPFGKLPGRGEGINISRYRLHPLPAILSQELDSYLRWCTQDYTPGRKAPPRRIRKRTITTMNIRSSMAALGGYAITYHGAVADELTLTRLTDPTLCQAFAGWWINERQGRVTRSLVNILIHAQTIAKYWFQDHARYDAIHQLIHDDLPRPEIIRDKRAVWLTLAELAAVSDSLYPFSARRLRESQHTRRMALHLAHPTRYGLPHGNGKNLALQAEVSLLIGLLIEWPWRQRQYRDMLIGQHLQAQTDGTFLMYFKGKDLKIGRNRDGRDNELVGVLSGPLAERMSEWLQVWRPILEPAPDEQHVFLTRDATPCQTWTLTHWVKTATYKLTGKRMTPHLVRDVWASEYLDATGDLAGAAHRLGNTPQTILQHYGHVLEARAQERTSVWLQGHLARRPPVDGSSPQGPMPSWRTLIQPDPSNDRRQLSLALP